MTINKERMDKIYNVVKVKKRKRLFYKILYLLIIFMFYGFGEIHGTFVGIGYGTKKYGYSLCEFMNKSRDTDGYCIMELGQGKESKYDIKTDCKYEKFRIVGKEKEPLWLKLIDIPRKILYYPSMGCW